jgi:hypothetical protein
MTLADICAVLTDQGFEATLAGIFGAGSTPAKLLAALGMKAVPDDEQCRHAGASIDAASDKSEWALVDVDGKPAQVAAAAVGLLAVLYAKCRGARNEFARYEFQS